MALAEIAEFILNVIQLIIYLFKISVFIGSLLVTIVVKISFVVWRILQLIGHFMVVFYEDYSFFIDDFRKGLSSIAIFCIECLSSAVTGTITLIHCIAYKIVAGIEALLSGRLLTVPLFTITFLKQLLLLIGDGVWFLVALPAHFVKNVWMCSIAVFNGVGCFSINVGGKSLEAAYQLSSYTIQNMPLQSTAGIVILLLACKYKTRTKKIAIFCYKVVHFVFRKLQPFGHRIFRKMQNCNEHIAHFVQSMVDNVLLCFVCMQRRAAHVYEAEIRRSIVLMRNFFVFTEDRRFPPATRPHLSRVANRQNHSSSEASSRSSSTASDQSSTEEGGLGVQLAQNSPTKRNPRSTISIGLCIICEDHEKSVVLVPCGHLCLCKRCADRLGEYDRYCPICRELICRKVDVYI